MPDIDLHGLTLDEAKEKVLDQIEELNVMDVTQVTLIHGHTSGQLVKNWINSPALNKELAKMGITLTRRQPVPRNPGATIIFFE